MREEKRLIREEVSSKVVSELLVCVAVIRQDACTHIHAQHHGEPTHEQDVHIANSKHHSGTFEISKFHFL